MARITHNRTIQLPGSGDAEGIASALAGLEAYEQGEQDALEAERKEDEYQRSKRMDGLTLQVQRLQLAQQKAAEKRRPGLEAREDELLNLGVEKTRLSLEELKREIALRPGTDKRARRKQKQALRQGKIDLANQEAANERRVIEQAQADKLTAAKLEGVNLQVDAAKRQSAREIKKQQQTDQYYANIANGVNTDRMTATLSKATQSERATLERLTGGLNTAEHAMAWDTIDQRIRNDERDEAVSGLTSEVDRQNEAGTLDRDGYYEMDGGIYNPENENFSFRRAVLKFNEIQRSHATEQALAYDREISALYEKDAYAAGGNTTWWPDDAVEANRERLTQIGIALRTDANITDKRRISMHGEIRALLFQESAAFAADQKREAGMVMAQQKVESEAAILRALGSAGRSQLMAIDGVTVGRDDPEYGVPMSAKEITDRGWITSDDIMARKEGDIERDAYAADLLEFTLELIEGYPHLWDPKQSHPEGTVAFKIASESKSHAIVAVRDKMLRQHNVVIPQWQVIDHINKTLEAMEAQAQTVSPAPRPVRVRGHIYAGGAPGND